MAMPPMLAYTIQGGSYIPRITIGQGAGKAQLKPDAPQDDSYWIVFLDANKPTTKVKEWIVPGSSNHDVPAGLDAYMTNPAYIFALVTQNLSTLHVPQGAFYKQLAAHGAGRDLQRLEQVNTSLGCGSISRVTYLLTGQGGPAGNFGYEIGSTSQTGVLYLMSLMPRPDGTPPYSICDSNTFNT